LDLILASLGRLLQLVEEVVVDWVVVVGVQLVLVAEMDGLWLLEGGRED
jgi:hypothetical protein